MFKYLALSFLLLGLSLGSCSDPQGPPGEDSQNLNATASIAKEIERRYELECHPYLQLQDGLARVEVKLSETELDHQSLASDISKFRSVQSFGGNLHLLFSHHATQSGSEAPAIWARYDAKTGKPLP